MEPGPSQSRVLTFGVFEVDLEARELRKSGTRRKLAGQPYQVLQLLLERPQEVVTREELQQRIWPQDTIVDYDLALKKAVNRRPAPMTISCGPRARMHKSTEDR